MNSCVSVGLRLLTVASVLVLAAGCDPPAESVSPSLRAPTEPAVPGGHPIARLNGTSYSVHEFTEYLAAVRRPGYRPATVDEGERLLRGFLRQELLERERDRRGLPVGSSGRAATVEALILEVGRAQSADPARPPTPSQVRAVLDHWLDRARVDVDRAALAALTAAPYEASAPLLPPGYGDGPPS